MTVSVIHCFRFSFLFFSAKHYYPYSYPQPMSPTKPECFHYKHLVDASKKQGKYYYYIIYYKGNCFFLVLNKGLNKATLKTSQLLKEKVFSCVSIFLWNCEKHSTYFCIKGKTQYIYKIFYCTYYYTYYLL